MLPLILNKKKTKDINFNIACEWEGGLNCEQELMETKGGRFI